MRNVFVINRQWRDGEDDSFNSIVCILSSKGSAEHEVAVLTENNLDPEITYSYLEWQVHA